MEPVHDETFGRLEWDSALECWLGGIDWPTDLHTEVAIWPSEGDPRVGLARAHRSLDSLREHEEQVRLAVAGEAAEVYNGSWNDEGTSITTAEFADLIELLRIGFESDGSLLLSYDAGEMFGGHVIDALFDTDDSLKGINLVG